MIQTKSTLGIIFILSICLDAFCHYTPPISPIDSLKSRLEITKCEENFSILLDLAKRTREEDPDQAESYMLDAKSYINENVVNQQLFDYYKYLAVVKLSQNQYEEVLELSEKALQFQFDGLDHKDHYRLYDVIGKAHYLLGENFKAQEALYSGLRIADSLKLDTLKADMYNTIGAVYQTMRDSIMTEKYLLLAIDQAKKVNKEMVIAYAQGNLATMYMEQKRYSEAEKLILEGIQFFKKAGNEIILVTGYNNLGFIYKMQKKYRKSLTYLKKAVELADQYPNSISMALGNISLAELYMELKDYELAKESIEIGLKRSSEVKNRIYVDALLTASRVYESSGEHSDALKYHKLYTALNDSLLSESRIKAVAELQEKYDSEKKEKEILTLSNEKASAMKRERTLIQTILLLCFGLFALGALFYFLRQNHVKNSIIQEKNLKIASDKIHLLEKGKEIVALESLVKGQETERERLAKEMHDGLGGLLAISHSKLINLKSPEMKTNRALREACDLVGDAYKQVRQISHNLMPMDLEKFGLVAALTNMIQRINQQNNINIDFRTYHFDLLFNNDLGLNIYRISQEAIANVLKCAKARNVLIELFQHEDMISLSIEDDGIGFNLDDINSGIGIRSMRNRTELFNGKFSIDSKLAVGTSIFVLFPYNSDILTPSQT